MKTVQTLAGSALVLVASAVTAGHALAANTIISPAAPIVGIVGGTVYQYGDTTFTFSASNSTLEVLPVMNGRGGTEIEIEEKPASGSSIFTGNAGAANQTLSFTVSVGALTGNRGISSVTNILTGTDVTNPGGVASSNDNTYVTSGLSTFTGVTASPTPISSNLTTTSTATTFSTVAAGSSFGFTGTLADNLSSAPTGYTLTLTNIRLLLNPAPEPASIAVLLTGMSGLIAARRRNKRGSAKMTVSG